jgi:hypothetical protein
MGVGKTTTIITLGPRQLVVFKSGMEHFFLKLNQLI